ncbi:MAG: hypothetical protein CMJ83_18445 [Planctomycetes bacterium]|nr:hypothetical protein [Planctomycetota bacterium]
MGERFLVVGVARSGIAAARLLVASGDDVRLCDVRGRPADLPDDVAALRWVDTPSDAIDVGEVDALVLSPGVPLSSPLVTRARARGCRISGEVEEAFRRSSVPVVAITGTNGKSTTTTLVAHLLNAHGRLAAAGGNLGRPYSELVLEESAADVHVVEVSSFQAETLDTFRARVAALLNLAPDHLDRHGPFDAYRAAKLRVFRGLPQPAADASMPYIACEDPPLTRSKVEATRIDRLLATAVLSIPGAPFRENVRAALHCVAPFGLDDEVALRALASFHGLPHRMEDVGRLGLLRCFNDSKATNVAAAVADLAGFDVGVHVIIGGQDDGQDFEAVAALSGIRRAWTIGASANRAASAFGRRGRVVGTMERAVDAACTEARAGELLVLAPAAKSFDQYRDFEHRGDIFRELISRGPSRGSATPPSTHFIAIGGAGMSSIAEILLRDGARVSGSDLRDGPALRRLSALGARCHVGHDGSHVADAARVVTSSAIRDDNPELSAARRRGLPILHRSEALAELVSSRKAVAVTGSHGKTTTTSLIGHLLTSGGAEPCVLVGADVVGWNGNALHGRGRVVCEADESDGSFTRLAPDIAVVTNLDHEHLDYWGSLDALADAVAMWAACVPRDGCVVLGAGDSRLDLLGRDVRARVVRCGVGVGDFVASDLRPHRRGTRFRLSGDGIDAAFDVPLLGHHHVANAALAIAACIAAGADVGGMVSALPRFRGVKRRFEVQGVVDGITVVDDYAHHPTEIAAVLAAVAAHDPRPVRVVFQPHRHSRTQALEAAFAPAFDRASDLIVTGVYAADEIIPKDAKEHRIDEFVRRRGRTGARRMDDPREILATLAQEARSGDLVLFLGAGNLDVLAAEFPGILRRGGLVTDGL